MQDADAQDLAQKVLMSVAAAIGDWKKNDDRVRFRHWLRRVARNGIINALSRQPLDRAAGGTSVQELLAEHADVEDESDAQIELEYRRELYQRAAKTVQIDVAPDTWRAFEMTVVENCSIDDAAVQLNKSVGNIYAARSRIIRRLRDEIEELEKG